MQLAVDLHSARNQECDTSELRRPADTERVPWPATFPRSRPAAPSSEAGHCYEGGESLESKGRLRSWDVLAAVGGETVRYGEFMAQEHFDVLVVGAGISGIAAGYHLQTECPDRSYAILERRDGIGGTWDLFRYPGIRSDSDMYTLGYRFRPWTNPEAIAAGPSILKYVEETASENGIDGRIRYGHHVKNASWSSRESRWSVETVRTDTGQVARYTCNFLFMCSGYYDYDKGYTPDFAGTENFRGRIVHPQKWTDDIDYDDKRVVVIGSGATAITLVPEMAKRAKHVTMLQRSPTYVVSAPEQDAMANGLRKRLPDWLVYSLVRWRNVIIGALFFWFCRRYPDKAKGFLLRRVREELGEDYDVDQHFTPRYNPWQERMCLVPNGDLFESLKSGETSVVTDHIETFTEKGIRLESGKELEADLVVTATGLNLQLLGGLELMVDGERVDPAKSFTYKGVMFSDIPNLALAVGYTNASWTLKCDLTCEYVCRLLNHMKRNGYEKCWPTPDNSDLEPHPLMDFTSGYIQRSIDQFPKQAENAPWKSYQNYLLDIWTVAYGSIDGEGLNFSRGMAAPSVSSKSSA